MSAAELLTQAEFAAAQGWNRSTVTRLKQADRLVMEAGRVNVAASLARIAATGGMRFDVAERHAKSRTQPADPPAADAAASSPPAADTPAGTESRVAAQARKEAAAADLMEIELAQKRGALIPKDDVDTALKAFAAGVRARLDTLPDQLAPLLAPVTDFQEVHALLAEHAREILAAVAADMARAAGEVQTSA